MAKVMGKPKTQKEKDKISIEKDKEQHSLRTIKHCKKHDRYYGDNCAGCLIDKGEKANPVKIKLPKTGRKIKEKV